MFDPDLSPFATQTMRRLLMAVSRDSYYYTVASVPAAAALSLANKWNERYELELNAGQRCLRKKQRKAVFTLIAFPEHSSTNITLWLLRTEGDHPLLNMETWRDARSKQTRLQWLHSYELVLLPIPVDHRKKLQGKKKRRIPSRGRTWQYTKDALKEKRALIRRQVSGFEDDRLRQVLKSLGSAPGFRGIRSEVKATQRYIEEQCIKHKKPVPEMPKVKWVGKFKKGTTVPLSVLVKRAAKGSETWFPQATVGPYNIPIIRHQSGQPEGQTDKRR